MAPSVSLLSFWGKISGKGKCIGRAKNGITVYRKMAKDGSTIISSYKNGQLYKTITRKPVSDKNLHAFVPWTSTGHRTVAVNHETGVTTYVDKALVDYKAGFSQFRADFNPGMRREFSVHRTQMLNGTEVNVGNHYTRIEAPGFLGQTKTRYLGGDSYLSKTTWDKGWSTDKFITAHNFKMPNGNTVTGEWGRNYWNNGQYSSDLMRGLGGARRSPLSMLPKGDGTYHISA